MLASSARRRCHARLWSQIVAPLLVVAAAPVLVFPGRLSLFGLILVGLFWVARLVERRTSSLDWPVALIAAMAIVGLIPSFDLYYSYPKLCGILLGTAVCLALADADPRGPVLGLVAVGLTASTLLIAVVGLVGADVPYAKFFDVLPVRELLPFVGTRLPASVLPSTSRGVHPNEVAGALCLLLPVPAALARSGGFAWPLRAAAGLVVALVHTQAAFSGRGR